MKRTISLILVLILLSGMSVFSYGEQEVSETSLSVGQAIQETGDYLVTTIQNPSPGSIGGEWAILGLIRANLNIPHSYLDTYYSNVKRIMEINNGKLTQNKYSEYSRMIIALSALGKDVTNVNGYNLLEKLADFELVKKQGINGPIFALIALDSMDYTIPLLPTATTQTTRDMLLDYILERQLPMGGFCLSGSVADPDVTALALQALANYKDQKEIHSVIDRGISALASMQLENGGYGSWGIENLESTAQVIVALTALGIDPQTDSRFTRVDTKEEKQGLITTLLKYQMEDGSFLHISGKEPDLMSTEQAMLAMASYYRFIAREANLYNMEDVNEGAFYEYRVTFNGQYMTFDQPPVNISGSLLVPMRAIFEALGAEVLWDQNTKTATATLGDREIAIKIGENKAKVNDQDVSLDVSAVLLNSKTLVPLRFVSENLGASVKWDANTNTASIVTE